MKIRELYSDPSKWIQHDNALDARDNLVCVSDPRAIKWCLQGAVWKCYYLSKDHETSTDAMNDVLARIRKELGVNCLPSWNDDKKRIFTDVKTLVEKLDI